MNTIRFLKIMILSLLLINIATLTFMWVKMPSAMDNRRPENPGEFLTRTLKLDRAQQEAYNGMKHDHHTRVEAIRMQAATLRHTMTALLGAPVQDTQRINALADSIGQLQKSVELITYHHFSELRAICNPTQQQRFDEVIHDAIQMMAPPQHPRNQEERE